MKLAEVSIKRPVFTAMVISAIVVFGGFLYFRLAVDMLPDVDAPVVTVTTIYPGATPETLESQVAEPIEEALGTLGGVDMMRSVCLESVSQVIIAFELDVDLDVAVQDVRDRIATIQGDLPDDAEEPMVEKLDLGAAPVLQLAVTGEADASELARFAEDVVQARLQQMNGVGQVELVGSREREVHVWLDPSALRSRGLTALEVVQSLGAQNIEIPGGRIDRGDQELILRTDASASSVEELERLALATIPNGGVIRLGDVARVVDGLEERRSLAVLDDQPAIAVVVRKQSGQNTVAVAQDVMAALDSLRALAPPGVEIRVLLDGSSFIRSSIEAVEFDLVLGALLAVLIIFFFLRDPRATFISALALPTSVIGTFAFIYVMGFTINILTSLALSLSIGILIDDAIVVIENIARRRSKLGESARVASLKGTSEIGLAVFATTLSIVAVFVPVAFTQGMVGRFLLQFGLTVAFAVMLSLFVSFTLTPMLSARLLSEHGGEERGLSRLIGRLLDGIDAAYRRAIAWVLDHRVISMGVALASLAGAVFIAPMLGFEMLPSSDRGQFNVRVEMPPGTSLDRTAEEARVIASGIRELPGVTSTFTRVGGGLMGQVNQAEILVTLVPTTERAYGEQDAIGHVRQMLGSNEQRLIGVESLPVISAGGNRMAPIEVILQGDDLEQLGEAAEHLAQRMSETEGFVDVETTLRPGQPEIRVDVDRGLAAELGVLGAPVAMTVRMLVAGQVATTLEEEGERHDVRVQLPPEARTSASTIRRSQVRSAMQQLVDVGTVATVVESSGPTRIDRYNRQRQVTVYSNLDGLAQSDAINLVEQYLAADLPAGVTYEQGGMGRELGETMSSLGVALLLAILCIYMVLASQFESFVHPFTIMISLPFSAIGAFAALLITGQTMSIMAMIGFIMLMGLVTKNAILLVDFANQRRREGMEMKEALIDAGATRLRPILMTTAAMIFGMLPAAIGHGEGGEMRSGMGITVIGGLLTSTVLTLLVVPVVYTFFDAVERAGGWLVSKLRRKPSSVEKLAEQSASS